MNTLDSGLLTGSPLPPSPPTPISCGSYTPLDEKAKYDISSLVVAINAMYGMIHASQTEIVTKLDERFSSLNTHLESLHKRFEKQDQTICEIASSAASRSDLAKVEAAINSVASQADSQFEEIHSELESVKTSLDYYKVDNMRLKHRLYELEARINLKEIKSK